MLNLAQGCRRVDIYQRLLHRASRASYSGEAVDFLQSLTNFERRGLPSQQDAQDGALDLGRMRSLAAALGDPQNATPVIHVAGSKGKGSTATMLASILTAAGYRTGLYTSPHILDQRERISLSGRPISAVAWSALVDTHLPTLQQCHEESGGRLTWFEAMTGLAYKYFQKKADFAVVEAGLGGEMDATNITQPSSIALSIITPLGLEHEDVLGKGIRAIAAAKAGIMKEGRPVLLSPQPDAEAQQVLDEHAERAGCLLVFPEFEVEAEAGSIQVAPGYGAYQRATLRRTGGSGTAQELTLRLVGEHQCSNAALAASAAHFLAQNGLPNITQDHIVQGLASATMLARFQVLQTEASHKGREQGAPLVVLDGAHTPPSLGALALTLRAAFPDNPLALVVAMARDKDHARCMEALRLAAPTFVAFTTVTSSGFAERSASPGVLAAHWQSVRLAGKRAPRCRETIQASVKAASDAACYELASKPGRPVVCICGSMYLAAEALAKLQLQNVSA